MDRSNFSQGQRRSVIDLGQALIGEKGTFTVTQGGQSFLCVAEQGHSITNLIPIGPRPGNWQVTKLSDETLPLEQYSAEQATGRGVPYRSGRGQS